MHPEWYEALPGLHPVSRLFILTISAVLAFTLTFAAADAQIIERELHRGIMEGPISLDPQYSSSLVERAVLTDLFMGLVTQDAAGKLQPGVAKSWKVENKGRRWVFKLREGVKWSDGRALVAGDFVYAFQRLLGKRSGAPFASTFYGIAGARELNEGKIADAKKLGVHAPDKLTVVFDLERPMPYFPSMLTLPAAFPLRKDLIERDGEGWTKPGRMVSNGPYILGEWLPGRYVKLRKNWRFYDPASVNIDNIFYDIVEHSELALDSFFSGKLSILSNFPREQTPDLLEKSPESVHLFPTLTLNYLVFNTRRPPFNDPRVRQALALAVDSRGLVQDVLDHGAIPATTMLPSGIANLRAPAQPAHDFPTARRRPYSPEYRMAEAKRLLGAAGYGVRDSLRITLNYNNSEIQKKVAAEIADMWKKLGVRVDIFGNHYAVHYGDLGLGDFDVARAGWIGDFNDPMAILDLFRSNNRRFNYGAFSDDKFDKMLARANAQDNPEERAIGLYRAQERALSQYPVVPLYFRASRNLIAPTVSGWEDNVTNVHPSRYLNIRE